ncbi:hypothetical protein [Methylorubrum thiocyanatum]|uniref:hypothetical protein n=1 Tax=Methylorubrum thiocyanatum TaxID=47958 RepID=UPI0035C7CD2A
MAAVDDIYLPKDLKEVRAAFDEKWALDEATGCWVWQACRNRAGYGRFSWPYPRQSVLAHRAAMLIYRRCDAKSFDVCHHCDNPSCVNPEHLFIGNRHMNMLDALAKERFAVGRKYPHAILDEDAVRAIRADKRTYKQIGAAYGVSWLTVRMVRQGRSWKHVI